MVIRSVWAPFVNCDVLSESSHYSTIITEQSILQANLYSIIIEQAYSQPGNLRTHLINLIDLALFSGQGLNIALHSTMP